MLRILLVAILSAIGSLGGIWGGYIFANLPKPTTAEGASAHGKALVFLTPEMFVAPIVTDKEVMGFLVTRFSFGVDPSVPNTSEVDDETLLVDLYYEAAFNGSVYRPFETKVPDASEVADFLLARGNEMAGGKHFTSAYILQVDLFNRKDIRRKVVEERAQPKS